MFLSVVCTSLLPVLVTEGGGREAPFLFNFLWRLGLVLGILVSLGLWGRWFLKAFFAQPGAWRLVLLAGPYLGTLAGVLNSVSFAGYSVGYCVSGRLRGGGAPLSAGRSFSSW